LEKEYLLRVGEKPKHVGLIFLFSIDFNEWRSCKKSVFAILFATILGFFPPAGGKR
jgi:hypothetical protein